MMDQAIKNFAQQFKYQPKIENAKQLKARKKFVVCGLGGSHLAAGIVSETGEVFSFLREDLEHKSAWGVTRLRSFRNLFQLMA